MNAEFRLRLRRDYNMGQGVRGRGQRERKVKKEKIKISVAAAPRLKYGANERSGFRYHSPASGPWPLITMPTAGPATFHFYFFIFHLSRAPAGQRPAYNADRRSRHFYFFLFLFSLHLPRTRAPAHPPGNARLIPFPQLRPRYGRCGRHRRPSSRRA